MTVAGDGSVELVHVGVGTVAFDSEGVGGTGTVVGRAEVSESGRGIAGLEVRLSVEVLGFDKGDVVVFGGSAYKDVSGDRFIVQDFDKVADADVLPEGLGPVYALIGGVIVELDRGI